MVSLIIRKCLWPVVSLLSQNAVISLSRDVGGAVPSGMRLEAQGGARGGNGRGVVFGADTNN
jgi:hypothetical protein